MERTGGVVTGVEELGHAASVILQGFTDRLVAREKLRDGELGEWTHLPFQDGEAYVIDVREGRLARVPAGESWILFFMYKDSHDMRLLTRGKRSHVERYAQEVLRYGPPGGPNYRGNELDWKDSGGDGTLRAATVGGEFRLMPLRDGGHLLIFARNDFAVFVLAMGGLEALQRDAEDYLLDHRGDALRVRLGDGKVDLHSLGAESVVGYLEIVHDMRLVLGHLAGDTFGLFHTRGKERTCVRLYTLAELRRGDLGCTLLAADDTERAVAVLVQPAATPPTLPRPMPPAAAEPVRRQVRRVARLGPEDIRLIHSHLKAAEVRTGPGSTIVPKILEGLCVLVELGVGDQLLRASMLRQLIADRARVHIHCCSKTLARALVAAAAHTRLLVREGRRWRLRLGELLLEDSGLLTWIKSLAPANDDGDLIPPEPPREARVEDPVAEGPMISPDIADPGVEPQSGEQPSTAVRAPYQRRIRTDGQPTFWKPRLPRLPDEECPSRWSGRKPRGPPSG